MIEVRIPDMPIEQVKATIRAYRAMLREGVSPLDSVEWGFTLQMRRLPDGSW